VSPPHVPQLPSQPSLPHDFPSQSGVQSSPSTEIPPIVTYLLGSNQSDSKVNVKSYSPGEALPLIVTTTLKSISELIGMFLVPGLFIVKHPEQ